MSSSNTLSLNPIFAPTQISSCVLWLDGADPFANGILPANGSTIGTWINKGTSAVSITNSGTPTFSNAAINSNGAVRFPGSAYLQDNGFIHTLSNKTYFLVTQGIDSTNPTTQGIMYFGNNGYVYNTQNGIAYQGPESSFNNQFGFLQAFGNGGYYYSYGASYANTPLGIYGDTCSNTAASIYVNGSNLSNYTLSYTPQNSTGFRIGRRVDSLGQYYNGYVCEVLAFNTLISVSQRQQTEGYLAWKWGLQASLPSTHPYRNTPVYLITSLPPQFRNITTIPLAPSLAPFSFINPLNVGGCMLWLDGADSSVLFQNSNGTNPVTAQGQNVSYWKDKSPSRINAVVAGSAPTFAYTNGYPSVIFNTSFLQTTTLPSATLDTNGVTFFAVAGTTNASSNQQVILQSSGPEKTIRYDPAYSLYSLNNATIRGQQNVYTSGILCFTDTAAAFNSFINGTNTYSTTSAVSYQPYTTSSYFLLGKQNGISAYFYGYTYEAIVYNTALSATQRQQVEGYLAWKWGLQASLPSNHPYKNAPPGLPVPSIPPRLTMNNGIFSPTSIAQCKLWLDAADPGSVIRSGSNVTQWTDKSGSGYNATQANASYYATYSNNSIVFNGTSSYLQISNPAIRPTNAYVVVQSAAATGHIYRKGYGSPGTFETALRYDTSNIQTLYNTTTDTLATAQYTAGVTASRVLLEATWNGTTITLYVNGTSSATASLSGSQKVASTGVTDMRIGAEFSSESNSSTPFAGTLWNGSMFEIVMYSTSLTTSQRQQVEGYLAWKWGLQGSLPATHPYKKFPPPP